MNDFIQGILSHVMNTHQQQQQQTHATNQGLLGVLSHFLQNPSSGGNVAVKPLAGRPTPLQDNISPQPFTGGDTFNPQSAGQGSAGDLNNPQSQALGGRFLQ